MDSGNSSTHGRDRAVTRRRSVLKAFGIGIGALAGGAGAIASVPTTRATNEVFEDFEMTTSELVEKYSTSSSGSGVSTSSAIFASGSKSLLIDGVDDGVYSNSDGPSAGDEFSYRIRATGGADTVNFGYGVDDDNNQYFIKHHFPKNNLFFYKEVGGGTTLLDYQSSGFTLEEDHWYDVTVDWSSDGTHQISLKDSSGTQLAELSAQDTKYNDGGLGFYAYISSGGSAYFDQVATPDATSPGSTTVHEDFETTTTQLKSDYTISTGDTGISIDSSTAKFGTRSLLISEEDSEIYRSTDGPSAGDTFSYWLKASGGADTINFGYGVEDNNNQYFIKTQFVNDELFLYKESGGATDLLGFAASDFTLAEDKWYHIEVDWQTDGTHIVTVFNDVGAQITQISGSDSEYIEGGLGYYAYIASGGSVNFDYIAQSEQSTPVETTSTTIDDFEATENKLGDYNVRYASSGSSATVVDDTDSSGLPVSSVTKSGQQSLRLLGGDPGASTAPDGQAVWSGNHSIEINSVTGLPTYPTDGNRVELSVMQLGAVEQWWFNYGVQDNGASKYRVAYDSNQRMLFVYRLDNDRYDPDTPTAAIEAGLEQGLWYTIGIVWDADGTHTVELLDGEDSLVTDLSITDTTYTSGGIGFGGEFADPSGQLFFDDVSLMEESS